MQGPCLCQMARNISLTVFSTLEKQSRHAEMTGLGTRRRHGGKELGRGSSRQRHGAWCEPPEARGGLTCLCLSSGLSERNSKWACNKETSRGAAWSEGRQMSCDARNCNQKEGSNLDQRFVAEVDGDIKLDLKEHSLGTSLGRSVLFFLLLTCNVFIVPGSLMLSSRLTLRTQLCSRITF